MPASQDLSVSQGRIKLLRSALPLLEQPLRRRTTDNLTSAGNYLKVLNTTTTDATSAASSPGQFSKSNIVGMQVVSAGSTPFVDNTNGAQTSATVEVGPKYSKQVTQTVLSFYTLPTTNPSSTVNENSPDSSVYSSDQASEMNSVNNPVISSDTLETLAGLSNLLSTSETIPTATPTAINVVNTVILEPPRSLTTAAGSARALDSSVSASKAAASIMPSMNTAASLANYLLTGTNPVGVSNPASEASTSGSQSLTLSKATLLQSIVQAIQASQQLKALNNTNVSATRSSKTTPSNVLTPARSIQSARASRARASMLAEVKSTQSAQDGNNLAKTGVSDELESISYRPENKIANFANLINSGQSTDDVSNTGSSVTISSPQLTSLSKNPSLSAGSVNDVADLMAQNNAAAAQLNGGTTSTAIAAVAAANPANALLSLPSMLNPLSSAANAAVRAASGASNVGTAAGSVLTAGSLSTIPTLIHDFTSMVKGTTLGETSTS